MKVGQKKMGAGAFGSDLMFWVKAILPLLLIEYVILFSCLEAKFGRGFQHARYVVDNNRRIPLWYPYEVHENYGTIELAYWGGRGNDDVLLRESRPAEGGPIQPLLKLADGIVDFQIGTNVVCGTRDVRSQKGRERSEDNPVVGIQYFLFIVWLLIVWACWSRHASKDEND